MSKEEEKPEQSLNEEEEDTDDEEDEDYVPGGEGAGQDDDVVSGDDEDDVVDSEEDGGCDSSSKKRKRTDNDDLPNKEVKTEHLSAEEEKAKSDALWAELNGLSSTTTTPKVTSNEADVKASAPLPTGVKVESSSSVTSSSNGESSEATAAPSSGRVTSQATSSTSSTPVVPRRSGGLSSLAASLGKKKGPSTLLKSKEDWETYKAETGLKEELTEHTKGKDSFVERQAFLSRADVRQFEKEKEIRDKIRSRRPLP